MPRGIKGSGPFSKFKKQSSTSKMLQDTTRSKKPQKGPKSLDEIQLTSVDDLLHHLGVQKEKIEDLEAELDRANQKIRDLENEDQLRDDSVQRRGEALRKAEYRRHVRFAASSIASAMIRSGAWKSEGLSGVANDAVCLATLINDKINDGESGG